MPSVFSLPWFYQQFCDTNGAPLAGGSVRTRVAGTSTDKATYSDAEGTTPNANPVVLDASGMTVMFLQADPYDFYVYNSLGVLVKTIEGINALDDTIYGIIKAQYGGECLIVGADLDEMTLTNGYQKDAQVVMPHFNNEESNVLLMFATSRDIETILQIGGGIGTANAVTEQQFYVDPSITGGGGDLKMTINDSGVTIADSLVVGSPTGGAKGDGTINAVAVYDDNVLLTGYVLDKAFNHEFSIEDWKKKTPVRSEEFNNRSDILLDIDKYNEFITSRKMLPTFEDVESTGNIPSTGAMIQKLWEVVEIQAVHIKQLNDRLRELEGSCK